MENTNQDMYIDSPTSQQEYMRRPQTPQRTISPTSASTDATIKPCDIEPPAYSNVPYMDSPPSSYQDSSPSTSDTSCFQLQQQSLVFHISTPTDCRPPLTASRSPYTSDDDDEEVPLAQLLFSRDAPPAYSTVVRQSYRETLLQHIPRYPGVMDTDEEAALERIREDDVRFTIERAVAMAVVIALLVLAGILVGLLFLRN